MAVIKILFNRKFESGKFHKAGSTVAQHTCLLPIDAFQVWQPSEERSPQFPPTKFRGFKIET
jgi:hypothetical protein